MKKAEAYWPLILLLALIKFVLPLFLQSTEYELQRDEYLYYEQGQHLALGYLENPPLLSWLGTISSWFGGSEAWIKIWPCFFGAATLVVTCLLTAELGGNRFAQFIAGYHRRIYACTFFISTQYPRYLLLDAGYLFPGSIHQYTTTKIYLLVGFQYCHWLVWQVFHSIYSCRNCGRSPVDQA